MLERLPNSVHDLFNAPGRTLGSLLWSARQREVRLAAPIFVVGCPRSGNRLTAGLLAAHPDLAAWLETSRVWDPVHYGDADSEHHFPAERATPAEIRRLHRLCEWQRRREGRARLLIEHPRNTVRIAFLRRVFPDARFVHVIRDGRAVVSSIVSQIRSRPRRQAQPLGGFCRPPGWRELLRDDLVEQSALQWRAIVRHARAEGAALGGDYREIRYEALCADPRATCRALFEFAGLPADGSRRADLPERLEPRGEIWRERLDAAEIETLERTAGDLLAELGYLR
jgi:hypothetical protein